MRAVSDTGDLAVLLAGLVQTLVAVDVDQSQLLHGGRGTQRQSTSEGMHIRYMQHVETSQTGHTSSDSYVHVCLRLELWGSV